MATFEVSAHMTVRPGQLEGFKKQAAECIRITKEKDTHTLRYDWFLSNDGTECEVREAYTGPEGLIEHNTQHPRSSNQAVQGLRRQPLHDGLRRADTTAHRSGEGASHGKTVQVVLLRQRT